MTNSATRLDTVVRLLPVVWLVAGSCGGTARPTSPGADWGCRPYPDQATSPYVLPYPVGDTHTVFQGNCGSLSHLSNTTYRYAYDFDPDIGSPVVATAAGRVVRVEASFPNSTVIPAEENYVLLAHGDGRFSYYGHLDQNGVFVEAGEDVQQGPLIGGSGMSGTDVTHLHFQVYLANEMTVPVTFRNTRPHPDGLVQGEAYTAGPY